MTDALDARHDPEAAAAARRHFWSRFLIYAVLTLFAIIYLVPLLVVFFNSLREQPEIAQNGLISLPRSFRFDAWAEAWGSYCIAGTCEGMRRNFFNSLWMTIPATIISTVLGAMNGYILSKWRFKGSEVLFNLMLLGVFMPGQISLMPWAFLLGKLGLTNSTYGLVLIHVIQGISFTTLYGLAHVVAREDLTEMARFTLKVPKPLARFIAQKGLGRARRRVVDGQ